MSGCGPALWSAKYIYAVACVTRKSQLFGKYADLSRLTAIGLQDQLLLECLVYTSHKREGQHGFTHPEGCHEGAARGTSRGVSKPMLSRPLVGGISFFFILAYLRG